MKRKRLFIILGIIIILLSVYYTLEWSSYTPTGAIRKYVFNNISKIEAFTLTLGTDGYIGGDKTQKQCFVNGVYDEKSGGNSLCFFYLKQDNFRKWYVSSCGSGP